MSTPANEEEDVGMVIEGRDEVEVYITVKGFVAIKQADRMGNQDALVLVHPDDVPKLQNFLHQAMQGALECRADPEFGKKLAAG